MTVEIREQCPKLETLTTTFNPISPPSASHIYVCDPGCETQNFDFLAPKQSIQVRSGIAKFQRIT
jgi:hypothetical protein